ncbi:MAG: glycosyltransferase [Microthrixaceae bacterium]|nr:glycosyltransferase [Acidimicrobiales bacterium]MCB9403083.1 glycosyltransferase [Microthrixaceae bacterium]
MSPQAPEPTYGTTAPVRVLTLVKGLDRGGAETLLLVGARHRDRAATTQRLAYLSRDHHQLVSELEAEGIPVSCVAPGSMLNPGWLLRLRRLMSDAEVVHSHSPVPAVTARLTALTLPRRRRPRLLTTEHNEWASHHPLTRLAERMTFRLDDAHLAVSEAVRSSLPASYRPSVEVLIAGVDIDSVRSQADRTGARAELGVTDGEVLVGTVANLRPHKGYPDLLRAARQVLETAPSVRFVAVGHGPSVDEITDLHRDLGLADRFTFLGHRRDAIRLMSGFDIFCLASHHEGLPVALMEALVLGIPVVTTRAGGIPELIDDGSQGRLVDIADVSALTNALLAEVNDHDARTHHSQHSAASGETLAIQRSVQRTEAIYAELTGRLR